MENGNNLNIESTCILIENKRNRFFLLQQTITKFEKKKNNPKTLGNLYFQQRLSSRQSIVSIIFLNKNRDENNKQKIE